MTKCRVSILAFHYLLDSIRFAFQYLIHLVYHSIHSLLQCVSISPSSIHSGALLLPPSANSGGEVCFSKNTRALSVMARLQHFMAPCPFDTSNRVTGIA